MLRRCSNAGSELPVIVTGLVICESGPGERMRIDSVVRWLDGWVVGEAE